jgi:Ca2+-binding RTX toxin-like protein
MPSVTVPGAGGSTVTVPFNTNQNLLLAQQIAAAISNGVLNGSILPSLNSTPPLSHHHPHDDTGGDSRDHSHSDDGGDDDDHSGHGRDGWTGHPGRTTGEYVNTKNGLTVLPYGYDNVVNIASSAIIFGSKGANQRILSGTGDLTFVASAGSGTIVTGGGNANITITRQDHGNWLIATGDGDDHINALGDGADTIMAGTGKNTIQLGAGTYSVESAGTDRIFAGSGAETITASQAIYIDGGQSSLNFVNSSGSSTVLGGTGSVTIDGGSGGGIFKGGTGGHNIIAAGTGAATLFGGGNGDLLIAQGSAAQVLYAGLGNETLNGAAATGNNVYDASAGNTTIQAGAGSDTFLFVKGNAGGRDLIIDFTSGSDKIALSGYGSAEITSAISGQTMSAGSVDLKLSDGTQIRLSGLNHAVTSTDFS